MKAREIVRSRLYLTTTFILFVLTISLLYARKFNSVTGKITAYANYHITIFPFLVFGFVALVIIAGIKLMKRTK